MTEKAIIKKWYNYKPFIKNGKLVEYYNSDIVKNLKDDTNKQVDICIIFSGRDRGKSFDVSSKAILKAVQTQGEYNFGYVRRNKNELTRENIESYFADKIEFLKDISDNTYDTFIYSSNWIYVAKTNTETDTIEKGFKIARVFSLYGANKYKSMQFPTIQELIIEEVFTDELYIKDEPNKVLNLISTIARGNRHITTWLISNTVSRVNPYISDWSLDKLYTQQPNTIDMYKLLTNELDVNGNAIYYLIACEYIKDSLSEEQTSKQELRKARMLNKKLNTSTLSNKWDERAMFPIISNKFICDYDCLYTCVFTNRGFTYLARIYDVPINIQECYSAYINDEKYSLSDDTMNVCYIERKTSQILNDRVFSDKPIIAPNYTRGIHCLNDTEMLLCKLIEIGRTFYATNLIGNEFSQNYRELKRIVAI